jgi:Outer membrane protein beta-barrel domain
MRLGQGVGVGLCLWVLGARPAAAQWAAMGAEVGYSRADLAGPGAEGLRPRQGALTGVYLSAPLGRVLTLRPELLFALKGGRAEIPLEDGTTVAIDVELAYMELPVLARISFPTGQIRPVLFAGPSIALRIGCDLQVLIPDQPVRATCGRDDFNDIAESDFGLVGGGGIEIRWFQAALALEARYTLGLKSIVQDDEVKNRVFGLALALTF